VREGNFRPVDARAVAEIFVTASIGMVEQEFASGQKRDAEDAVGTLMGVILHGISAERSEA
jgi:hypothetical protein